MRAWAATGMMLGLLPLFAGCGLVVGLGDQKSLGGDAGAVRQDAAEVDGEDGGASIADAGMDEGADADAASLQPYAIAVGGTHACAVVQGPPGDPANGTVRCWGSNTFGELGVDPTTLSDSPTPVAAGTTGATALTDVSGLALGSGYSCASTATGYLLCWGAVPRELASGVHREQETPTFEPSLVDVGSSRFIDVTGLAAGPQGGAVTSQDVLVCWGTALYEQRDGGSGGPSDAGVALGTYSAAAVGRAHACAITAPTGVNDVECWGDNGHGQTGVPARDEAFVPYPTYVGFSWMTPAVGTIVAVAAGSDFSCALTDMGAVWCWGANDKGQLGNPAVTTDTNVPQPVAFGSTIVAKEIALGDDHGCAVTAGSSVRCWGDDTFAQLGVGGAIPAFGQPVQVHRTSATALADALHIAAGGNTTCVTRALDSQVWCWGANDSGQTGQPASVQVVEYATAMTL